MLRWCRRTAPQTRSEGREFQRQRNRRLWTTPLGTPALLLVLFAPAAQAEVFLEAEVGWQVSGDFQRLLVIGGQAYNKSLGRIALVYERPVTRRVDLRLALEHHSFLQAHDRGEEIARVGVRIRLGGAPTR
jgi:hypothetical protein